MSFGGRQLAITVKDVAKKAEVSVATAARVLGGYGSASEATRNRVLEAARLLGYRPNAIARSMVKQHTNTLGLIIPDICNNFFTVLARGVEDVAQRYGYRIVLCNTDELPEHEHTYINELVERRIDGLILASATTSAAHLPSEQVGLVLVDRQIPGAQGDVVRVDNQYGAYIGVKHLLQLGHRRIGIVVGPETASTTQERLAGYRNALDQAGIAYDPQLVHSSSHTARGQGATEYLLGLSSPPTALFTANNVVTTRVLLDVRRLGIRVPADLAIVTFDDLELAELVDPPLTVVSQPAYTVGTTAAQLLLSRLEQPGHRQPPEWQEIVFQPSLVVRDSCGRKQTGSAAD